MTKWIIAVLNSPVYYYKFQDFCCQLLLASLKIATFESRPNWYALNDWPVTSANFELKLQHVKGQVT